MATKSNNRGPTAAPQTSTPSPTAAERGFPPPDPISITHPFTPASRIQRHRGLIEANTHPDYRANHEAIIKYYEEGGRCPQGKEELWAIDGQLYWGIKFKPEDFPNRSYWDGSPKFCETFKWQQ